MSFIIYLRLRNKCYNYGRDFTALDKPDAPLEVIEFSLR